MTALMPNAEWIDRFAAALPKSYRHNFGATAIAEHARIAFERQSASANVGLFATPRGSGEALCVIADDRPGLLATISAALVITGLDVIEAEAYTRRVAGQHDEAVDVFWVRHEAASKRAQPVAPEEVEQFRLALVGLIEGKLEHRGLGEAQRALATPSSSETVVRFIENADGNFSTLEVETSDRSGLLLALSQALFNQRVQIIGSQVKTMANRVFDRFHIVELDGSPIGAPRRLEIQVAILSAVDPVIERQRASAL